MATAQTNSPVAVDVPACGPSRGSALGERLFALVQADQGHAHISDGIHTASDADVVRIARVSLMFTRRSARKLARFIKQHEAQNP